MLITYAFVFVLKFDDLVEVFTDKLVAKIPASADGVVKEVRVQVDEVCLVGHTLLSIEIDDGEAAETPATSKAPDAPKAAPSAPSSGTDKAASGRPGPGK